VVGAIELVLTMPSALHPTTLPGDDSSGSVTFASTRIIRDDGETLLDDPSYRATAFDIAAGWVAGGGSRNVEISIDIANLGQDAAAVEANYEATFSSLLVWGLPCAPSSATVTVAATDGSGGGGGGGGGGSDGGGGGDAGVMRVADLAWDQSTQTATIPLQWDATVTSGRRGSSSLRVELTNGICPSPPATNQNAPGADGGGGWGGSLVGIVVLVLVAGGIVQLCKTKRTKGEGGDSAESIYGHGGDAGSSTGAGAPSELEAAGAVGTTMLSKQTLSRSDRFAVWVASF
jgi:hypothetical protein